MTQLSSKVALIITLDRLRDSVRTSWYINNISMGLSVISQRQRQRQRNVNWHIVKALDKAAIEYMNSAELQNCYNTRDKYFEKKLGHVFDPGKRYGSSKGIWSNRLSRCRQLLKGKAAKKIEARDQKREKRSHDVRVTTLRKQFFQIFSKRIKLCLISIFQLW